MWRGWWWWWWWWWFWVCVCVCVRERERERERFGGWPRWWRRFFCAFMVVSVRVIGCDWSQKIKIDRRGTANWVRHNGENWKDSACIVGTVRQARLMPKVNGNVIGTWATAKFIQGGINGLVDTKICKFFTLICLSTRFNLKTHITGKKVSEQITNKIFLSKFPMLQKSISSAII